VATAKEEAASLKD